jgi:hypothetical protein
MVDDRPAASIRDAASTNTSRAMPAADASAVRRRRQRLSRL